MKAVSLFIVYVFLLFAFVSCEKEEEKPYVIMTLQSTVSEISEFGLNGGKIDISVSGGEKPFSFFWSNSKQCEDLDSLGPGIYSVQITDNKNEFLRDTFELIQPAPDTLKV